MVFVGIDDRVDIGTATLSRPNQVVESIAAHHISQFQQFPFQGLNPVGLLDAECVESLEMEGDAFQDTCQNNGLSKVGLIDETIVQPWEGDGVPAESDSSGNPFLGVGESSLHSKHVEEVAHHGVALQPLTLPCR